MEVEREGGRREEGIFSAQVPVVLSHDDTVVVGISSEGPSGSTERGSCGRNYLADTYTVSSNWIIGQQGIIALHLHAFPTPVARCSYSEYASSPVLFLSSHTPTMPTLRYMSWNCPLASTSAEHRTLRSKS